MLKILSDIPVGFGRGGRRRKVTAPFHWYSARLTSGMRQLPDFIIVGAMKAGTTSLTSYLFQHPRIAPPRRKEIHYFDSPEYAHGDRWYRAHFPVRRAGFVTGEASPYYFCHPHCPARAHALVPDARLIVMLRNPIDRALSHYHHQVRHGREPLPFDAAIDAEADRLAGELERMLEDERYYSHPFWAYSYLTRGRYAEQLERWLRFYPRERMLIIGSESFYADPERWHSATLDFLGLERVPLAAYPRHNFGEYQQMDPALRTRLDAYFRPLNQRLEELLGERFDWR